jgi:hypothetical protein
VPSPEYIRTDTFDDAISSLELATLFYERAHHDERYCKWFVLALHSGVQGCFALALDGGNSLLVQKPGVAAKTLAALDAREVPPEPHMENFLRLYKKLQAEGNLRSYDTLPLPESEAQASSLASLDELRDNFIHFNSKSWSISKELVKSSSRECAAVASFVLLNSRAVVYFDAEQESRARSAVESLVQRLQS